MYDPTRRRWADKFLDRQLRILRAIFQCDTSMIRLSDLDEDMRHATDAYVGNLKISLRMRRHTALKNAGKDFLVRLGKDRGESEHEKIARHGVAFMLYCYASEDASGEDASDEIARWYLLDMSPLTKAVGDGMREVMVQTVCDGDDLCLAVDIDSLTSAYGQTIRAVGFQTVTTTTTDGLTTSTRTITTSIDPLLSDLVNGWAG